MTHFRHRLFPSSILYIQLYHYAIYQPLPSNAAATFSFAAELLLRISLRCRRLIDIDYIEASTAAAICQDIFINIAWWLRRWHCNYAASLYRHKYRWCWYYRERRDAAYYLPSQYADDIISAATTFYTLTIRLLRLMWRAYFLGRWRISFSSSRHHCLVNNNFDIRELMRYTYR